MTRESPAQRQRLPRRHRLRTRQDYVSLQHVGRRRSTPHFVLLRRPRPEGAARLGITVSRRVGGAVMRNRVKRRVRDWFRRQRLGSGAPMDLVVIARPGAADLSYAETVAELSRALDLHLS